MTGDANDSRPLARVPAAALEAGLTPRILYDWVSRGVIPQEIVIRSGRAIWIRVPIFRAWLSGAHKLTNGDPT